MRDPRAEAPPPELARRIAASFKEDRATTLARSDALMELLPERDPELDAARREMVLSQVARDAGLPESYFHIKKMGLLRIGIGSALSAKYLLRVEGPSNAADDDVMLEAKEILSREGLACIQVTTGPSRIFTGEQRLAYQPFRFPGVLHVGGKTFWVHAWTDHYVELDIQKSLRSPDEMREVAFDVGVQLGRGHPKRVDEEDGTRLRLEILRSLPNEQIRKQIMSLTDETIAAWNRFKSRRPPAPEPGMHPVTPSYLDLLFVLLLATFIGLGVIQRVSRLLHTPLMSLTNAISAIAVVGAIVVAGQDHPPVIVFLGALALFASMTNIVSGFLITDRHAEDVQEGEGQAVG